MKLYKTKETLSENETDDKNIMSEMGFLKKKKKHLIYCIVDYREVFL